MCDRSAMQRQGARLEKKVNREPMTPQEIANTLTELFDAASVQTIPPDSWQVETPAFRLLVLLTEDLSWVRVLLPIMPAETAQPVLAGLLEANFDETQEVRYAISQGVVWGVFHHNCHTLVEDDFKSAIAGLVSLHEQGLSEIYNRQIESRIGEIIKAAKQQGQTLETTLQNLDHLYSEGLMGDLSQTTQEREQVLSTWKRQLEKLWGTV